jgi:hypothetical protein
MSRTCSDAVAGGGGAVLGVAQGLHLAAAPAFATMALLTSVSGSDMLCGAASPLGGMLPMYLLMSAFHLPPWLKLIARQFSLAGCVNPVGRLASDKRRLEI